jgi:arylsulfatase A-like enzyme
MFGVLAPGGGEAGSGQTRTIPVSVDSYRFLPSEPAIQFARPPDAPPPERGVSYALGEGWSGPTAEGIRFIGRKSVLQLSLVSGGQRSLFLECQLSGGTSANSRPEIEVGVNATACGRARITEGTAAYRFDVPAGLLHSGANQVEVCWRAHEGIEPGTGGPVVTLRRLAALRDPAQPFVAVDWSPPVQQERNPPSLRIGRAGTLLLPFAVPASARGLTFELRAGPEPGAAVAGCRALLCRLAENGEPFELLDQIAVEPGQRPPALLEMQLDRGAGDYQLLVQIEDGEAPGELAVISPRLILEPEPTVSAASGVQGVVKRPLPDIVFLILDAARADHLGRTYGYPRDTAPALDRLARESLVFTRVFAQAPDTTFSAPTLLTGVPFASHRVGAGKRTLSSGETTLAEYLHDAGYFTVGFFPSPKLSSVFGLDQGYDELHERWPWKDGGPARFRGVAESAAARIRAGFGPAPLLFVMHVLPPHMPYQPLAEFNLFSDAEYDGPCDGSTAYARAVNLGQIAPSARDLREMVALYDGNLRMADHDVSLVLDALIGSGRFANAVVMVTADHGEAFLEHGVLGHSATLYQEVLHVPLILRLPPALRPEAEVDTDRLASLEDVVPTLLKLVGLEPGSRVTGVDLLADGARDAIVLHSPDSLLGILTRGSKLIEGPDGRRELYDLANDPAETRNLALEDPLRTSVLELLLARRLDAAPPPLEAAERAKPSREEEQGLRALGYLQ